jgi:hypothetical protein
MRCRASSGVRHFASSPMLFVLCGQIVKMFCELNAVSATWDAGVSCGTIY